MSTHSYTTSIELCINGHSCEREVTIHYEYSPAGGDGWHEPRYSERATLCEVECWLTRALDLLPLLSKEVISGLEDDCCQHEEDEREYRSDQAAEWKREEMRA